MPKESMLMMEEAECPPHTTLFTICEDVHAAINTSGPPLDSEKMAWCKKLLKTALDNWKPGHKNDQAFDAAALLLVQATYNEILRAEV